MANAFYLMKAIYDISYFNHSQTDARWTALSTRISQEFGGKYDAAVTRARSTDIILRQLERELLEIINDAGTETPALSVDMLMALSDSWLFTSYDVIRSIAPWANAGTNTCRNIIALHDRLDLIRLPIATAEVRSTNRAVEQIHTFPQDSGTMSASIDPDRPSTVIEKQVCAETGTIIWFPIDRTANKPLPICRLDLSNEFLSLFD